jgi:hypothetical protein
MWIPSNTNHLYYGWVGVVLGVSSTKELVTHYGATVLNDMGPTIVIASTISWLKEA